MRLFLTNSDSPLEDNFEEVLAEFKNAFKDDPVSFDEADIMIGASCGAMLIELKEWAPYVFPAATLAFFQGKRIEENLEAWGKISERIKGLLTRVLKTSPDKVVTVDNRLAASIALAHLAKETHGTGYKLHQILGINGYVQEVMDCTDELVEEQMISTFLSYHCIIELDYCRFFGVTVDTEGRVISCAKLSRELDG